MHVNFYSKPTTRKGKKVLLARQPQVIEGPKRTVLFQGRKCGQKLQKLLRDFFNLKKPDAVMLSRKNDITVFEECAPVERICRRHDSSLFIMGNHNKKRPSNIVLGRMFDGCLLDMVELGVDLDSYTGLDGFPESVSAGIKPCLVFSGPRWEDAQRPEMQTLRSILVDMFHREKADAIRLQGLEHVLCFTATPDDQVLVRSYRVLLKKSGERTPRIELEEIGPRVNLTLRRSRLASEDLMKQALRKPKVLKVVKRKNISVDGLGTTRARIHVGKQQINRIQTRKMKGLRKTMAERKAQRLKQAQKSTAEPATN